MSEKSYFVRTCRRTSEGKLISPSRQARGFVWPEEIGSVVSCPDWEPDGLCGHGLHGLRPGDNSPGTWANGLDAVWMVCSYKRLFSVNLQGKVKVPWCMVEYVVDLKDDAPFKVTSWLRERGITEPIYRGHAVVGDDETAKVGCFGKAVSGNYGISIADYCGWAIADHGGQATSGQRGFSKVGHEGVATTGDYGTAIAGDRGKAIAGFGGFVAAGEGGTIQIQMHMDDCVEEGHIGENGLKPNTVYFFGEGAFKEIPPGSYENLDQPIGSKGNLFEIVSNYTWTI